MTRELREHIRRERAKIVKQRYLHDIRREATNAIRERSGR